MNEETKAVDFVFIDHRFRPYRMRTWGNSVWLFCWTADKTWASLRQCSRDEVEEFKADALTPDRAKFYEGGTPFLNN